MSQKMNLDIKSCLCFTHNLFAILPKLMSLAICPTWCENLLHLPQARRREADITMRPNAKDVFTGDVQGDCGGGRPWPVYLSPILELFTAGWGWVVFHSVFPMPVLSRGNALTDTVRNIPNRHWTTNLSPWESRAESWLYVTRGSQ
jgi:hypothetical protein